MLRFTECKALLPRCQTESISVDKTMLGNVIAKETDDS